MDGFLEFPVDQSLSIDIHTMMSQLSIQLPFIQYSCLMFDNYFVVDLVCLYCRFGVI